MKKLMLLIATTILIAYSTKSYSQVTTEEEYNYVIKGYQAQVEGGLDMKTGYILKDIGEWAALYTDGTRGFKFIGLYRAADTKPCAIMAVYQKKDNGKLSYQEYYCIPTSDAPQNLWDRTMQQLNANFGKPNANEILAGMAWSLMKFSAQEVAK
jgi:hypothetical protein